MFSFITMEEKYLQKRSEERKKLFSLTRPVKVIFLPITGH